MVTISVGELLKETAERLGLKLVSGKNGFSKRINTSRIQKPGLLLTGLLEKLHPERIQIFGKAEVDYLNSLSSDKLKTTIKLLEKVDAPCFIVTRKQKPPAVLLNLAEKRAYRF